MDHDAVIGLLTRPTHDFPAEAIPAAVAEAVWARTLGQPYLTQLYGQLIVIRLNESGRRQGVPADVAAVEPELLDQAGTYLRHTLQVAPPPARAVLEQLAEAEVEVAASASGPAVVDLSEVDRTTRRYLRRRSLVTERGGLGIPVLGAFIRSQ